MPLKTLRLFIIAILVIGIFFRFANLDGKVYWFDEVVSSLRISGYTEAEVVQSISDSHLIEPKTLQKYQQINPEKNVIDTIKSLALEDPQHPPLYYGIARFWAQQFGSSVSATRSLSALFSMLAFPCIYWLCIELFESQLTGWVAVALIAVSPLHLVYAQEARQYSFWVVTILLSSSVFLRAIRLKTKFSWIIYATTLTLGLYTFLFTGLVAIGHGIYIVINEAFRFTKVVRSYLIATLASVIIFMPWLLIVVQQFYIADKLTSWTRIWDISHKDLVKIWIHNISLALFDIGEPIYNVGESSHYNKYFFIYATFVSLVGYSVYFLCRYTPRRIWLFVLTLTNVTALTLILPDLVLGGQRSVTPRYSIPSYLGIQLAIAYLISSKLTPIFIKSWKYKLWQLVLITIVSCEVFSCIIYSHSEIWWNKFLNVENPVVSQIINKATKPLLVTNSVTPFTISLSYMLEPRVKLLIEPKCANCTLNLEEIDQLKIPQIPSGFSDVFLFNAYPTKSWINEIENQHDYKVELVFKGDVIWLWRLK